MRFDAHYISHTGRQSTRNEDSAFVDVADGVFVIADGLGGRPAGDLASRTAVTSFVARVRQLAARSRSDADAIREVVQAVNTDVHRLAEGHPELTGTATTLSAVLIGPIVSRIVHVGDSRIYLVRDDCLTQLTVDHTLVAELIRHDHLSAERARQYPLRHVLSRAIGTCETVDPDVDELTVQANDWLILMTDGLHSVLGDANTGQLIDACRVQTPEQVCTGLVRAALDQDAGDDLTVIAVRVRE